ncbi:LysR family transcriptional regulator [Ottowia thiooxydans]|uniref:LysR family transcriptional regulator n=1 Tax=Ottowia thiooxydans TaxID=219182 RepID=UPI00048DCF5F|nr:LysR family transcriptional regulator [Ottowia thiooxydans]
MNLSWLEDFLALASTGNFSRAAEERHMTQPAFGRRVRALEEWIGAELFDRSSQPVRLTHAGQWFQSVAHDLLDRVARIPGETRAVVEAGSSSLRFAATHALSFTFVPGWLRKFESLTMAGTIQLESDVLQRCEALMEQSKVQFVICHAHPQAPGKLQVEGFPSLKVGADVLVPVSVPGPDGQPVHQLQGGHSPVSLLTYSDESGLGRILRETQQHAVEKIHTNTVFTAHLASVLKTMVLDSRGMAWVPHSLVADEIATGRLVAAASEEWCIDLEIRLYRAHRAMGRAAQALWDAVSDQVNATP